ncbi:unnamed protein product [Linum tenue]|uniref:Uncharacterized protein n=1 Tax=Linum tenue TaxID=586396 RepID=A0AAV0HXZ7_9ROSI|nr:unnamed protein product [Linum tenue]
MGGGNGQKSKTARERNLEKLQKAANKGSQLQSNKKAMTIQVSLPISLVFWFVVSAGTVAAVGILQCKVCMQTFICTTSEAKCREHAEAKHPKSDVYTCFPHLSSK